MTYQELAGQIKKFSIAELEKLRDSLGQQINMVYQTSDPDPESLKADLKDQLNAVMGELKLRKAKGQKDIGSSKAPNPAVKEDNSRVKPSIVRKMKRNPWRVIALILIGFVVYKYLKK